jgi:DNA polymerase III alpha subunit
VDVVEYHNFECGCRWPVLGPPPTPGALPLLDIDLRRLPDCPRVWELLSRGETKGVWQLESQLGRQWSRRLRPKSVEHLCALGALLRPGCLGAIDEQGVSMTEHYCRRANGEEAIEPLHPALNEILSDTYNVLSYQEQSMRIGAVLAGFDLKTVDRLRKAIGKKDQKELSEVRDLFFAGVREQRIVTEDEARLVWSWIEKSGRYQFNKCLAEDEVIRRASVNRYRKEAGYSVGHLYRLVNEPGYARSCGQEVLARSLRRKGNYGSGLSMGKDGRIRRNLIVAITPAGNRPVVRLTTRSGATIRVTGNHKFPTTDGILTGYQIATRLAAGAAVSLFRCEPDRDGGEYSSLPDPVVLVEPAGECQTYDVTMQAPDHNFVTGGGIVTCNSHSLCYGLLGYDCAYIKAHFPVQFFASWLRHANDKSDPMAEKAELIGDARLFDVPVRPPDLRQLNAGTDTDGLAVYFGLSDIKGVGPAQVEDLRRAVRAAEVATGRAVGAWSWWECQYRLVPEVNHSLLVLLAQAGAFDWLKVGRRRAMAELEAWRRLTPTQSRWLIERAPDFPCLTDGLYALGRTRKEGGGCAQKKHAEVVRAVAQLLERPPSPLEDDCLWLAWAEEELFGLSLSCTKVDACDLSDVNASCRDVLAGRTGFLVLGVEVRQLREVRTKKGKNPGSKMAFLTLSDGSGSLEGVTCFPDVYARHAALLRDGETVLAQVENDKRGGSPILKKVWPLEAR